MNLMGGNWDKRRRENNKTRSQHQNWKLCEDMNKSAKTEKANQKCEKETGKYEKMANDVRKNMNVIITFGLKVFSKK